MNRKKKYVVSIIAGLFLIVLGFLYQIFNIAGNVISLIFINAGIIVMVVAVMKYNKLGAGVVQDEMTRTVSAQSLAHSWIVTFVVMNMLFWIDYLQLVHMSSQVIFSILIFTMLISATLFKQLLYRKIKS